MRSWLICNSQKNPEVKNRRDPEDQIEDQRAKEFREHHLPVANRGSRERFNGAELKFFCEKPHGDQGKDQNEGEPEEDRIKKCLLNRVLHLALVHEGDLKIKIDPADDEKKDEHDVRDR